MSRLELYIRVTVSNTQRLVENDHWLLNVCIILLYSVCYKYFSLQQTLNNLCVSYFRTDFAADHKYMENFTQNFTQNFLCNFFNFNRKDFSRQTILICSLFSSVFLDTFRKIPINHFEFEAIKLKILKCR
jgi:hypothetical protein